MTDRELLERAAKAAGIIIKWHEVEGGDSWCYVPEAKPPCDRRSTDRLRGTVWNPLTDDGDALRLAVTLRIDVEPWIHGDSACARAACKEVLIDEPHYGDDPGRATRRAIVRAAAAMGEKA